MRIEIDRRIEKRLGQAPQTFCSPLAGKLEGEILGLMIGKQRVPLAARWGAVSRMKGMGQAAQNPRVLENCISEEQAMFLRGRN